MSPIEAVRVDDEEPRINQNNEETAQGSSGDRPTRPVSPSSVTEQEPVIAVRVQEENDIDEHDQTNHARAVRVEEGTLSPFNIEQAENNVVTATAEEYKAVSRKCLITGILITALLSSAAMLAAIVFFRDKGNGKEDHDPSLELIEYEPKIAFASREKLDTAIQLCKS